MMNLALQKRNEQLERWRQNEASAERELADGGEEATCDEQQVVTGSDTNRANKTNRRTTFGKRRGKSSSSESNRKPQVKFSNSTLFLAACANADLAECERLIGEQLVDIDVTTGEGLTGLHEATICGNAQMVAYLIESGANINCCDNEGWTPLHAASNLGQERVVELLLDYGADVTIVNCDNMLAYDLARTDRIKALIGEHLQDVDIEYLRSQEQRAIQRDIEHWLKTGCYDERSHPITRATVLHVLAAKGHIKLIKQILESPVLRKQIDLEAKDVDGFTPLLAASFWSQTEIVELLIEYGANIFAQANNGYKLSSIHLKNYRQSKLQQPLKAIKQRSVDVGGGPDLAGAGQLASLKSHSLSVDVDDEEEEDAAEDGGGLKSVRDAVAQKHYQLAKSRSLDISKQQGDEAKDESSKQQLLIGSLSVDRLLARCESLTERELRRLYKELVMEYEKLRDKLKGIEDKEKQRQQEWIRKERQMQRKISELEEENRQLEQWKEELGRLKDENSSLIRVVTKLSKKN